MRDRLLGAALRALLRPEDEVGPKFWFLDGWLVATESGWVSQDFFDPSGRFFASTPKSIKFREEFTSNPRDSTKQA